MHKGDRTPAINEKNKQVLLLQSYEAEHRLTYELVATASSLAGASAFRIDELFHTDSPNQETVLSRALEIADVVIADLTGTKPNVMYELGLAIGRKKPIVLVSSAQRFESIPFDLAGIRVLSYDFSAQRSEEFILDLSQLIAKALATPEEFKLQANVQRANSERDKSQVFISYSHQDSSFLKRLLVHLRPLERDGKIVLFADTQLTAGDKWKKEIEKALTTARVAILLVSADFLASDFIVNNELPPLLHSAEHKGTKIIPVIAKPCRFTRYPGLREFQAVNDPVTPLINLPEGRQEEIYDQIAKLVEDLVPMPVGTRRRSVAAK